MRFERFARRSIVDNPCVQIRLYFVAVRNRACRLFAFQNCQADIDRVAIENASKALCDYERNAALFNGERRVLTRRTAAEVVARNHDIACLYFVFEVDVDIFHAMGRELFFINRVQIACGNDHVRIDVVAVFDCFSVKFHNFYSPFFYSKRVDASSSRRVIRPRGLRFYPRLRLPPLLRGTPNTLPILRRPYVRRSYDS